MKFKIIQKIEYTVRDVLAEIISVFFNEKKCLSVQEIVKKIGIEMDERKKYRKVYFTLQRLVELGILKRRLWGKYCLDNVEDTAVLVINDIICTGKISPEEIPEIVGRMRERNCITRKGSAKKLADEEGEEKEPHQQPQI